VLSYPAVSASEVIIGHLIPVPPLTGVRSTLLQSSLGTLRNLGLFERWRACVCAAHRERIEGCLAPEWLPAEVAMAHYEACEALGLNEAELVNIGRVTAGRLQGTFLDTLARTARNAGVTPWAALPYFDRLHARILRGGSVQFMRTGPKDALIEWRAVPLFRFAYYRHAYTGFVVAALKMIAARAPQATITEVDERNDRVLVRAAWV
jgi:hypothetical protein